MKIGLQIYIGGEAATPEFFAATAQAVEAGGFHSIWAPEHVVLFPTMESKYPYQVDGRFPFDATQLPMEPFTMLAWMAALTKRVRLATGIVILPQRNPVYTAKQAADVDVLSGGRLDFGIGVGWLKEEFDALQVPWEHRGSRAADYIGVMRSLWCDEVSSYKGTYYSLEPCYQSPKPVQKPHPPLFFGGESDASFRRVARFGGGWFGANLSPEQLTERLPALDAALTREGRSRKDVQIYLGPKDGKASLDQIKRYRDAGVEQIVLALSGRNLDRFLARVDTMANELVAPAAAL